MFSGNAKRSSFFAWNVGERLVVYLAVCDLFLGTSHTLDHSYMMATKNNPPVSRAIKVIELNCCKPSVRL